MFRVDRLIGCVVLSCVVEWVSLVDAGERFELRECGGESRWVEWLIGWVIELMSVSERFSRCGRVGWLVEGVHWRGVVD